MDNFCFYQNDHVYKNKIYWIRKRYELSRLCLSYVVDSSIIKVRPLFQCMIVAFALKIVLTSPAFGCDMLRNKRANEKGTNKIRIWFNFREALRTTIRRDRKV